MIKNAHRTPSPALHFITALSYKLQSSEEKNAPGASDDKAPLFLTLSKHMIDAALLPEMNFFTALSSEIQYRKQVRATS